MKNIFVPYVILFLCGCNAKKEGSVSSQSPDGAVTVSITAARDNGFDPFNVEMEAEGSGIKGNVTIEVFANEISSNTVNFLWEDNDKCTITFLQKDDTKRIFELTPYSSIQVWKDISPK